MFPCIGWKPQHAQGTWLKGVGKGVRKAFGSGKENIDHLALRSMARYMLGELLDMLSR